MQGGVFRPSCVREVGELLDGGLLAGGVMCPSVAATHLPLLVRHHAEKVLEPVIFERESFHLEEEVSRIGPGTERYAA